MLNEFKLPSVLNTKGCYRVSVAVIQNLLRSFFVTENKIGFLRFNEEKKKIHALNLMEKDYFQRIKFVEDGKLFRMTIDVMGYDFEKIKNELIKKINSLYEKENNKVRLELAKIRTTDFKKYGPIWNVESPKLD